VTRWWRAWIPLALGLPAAPALGAAQLTGAVDLSAAEVHYDGFLPSFAASLTPSARVQRGLLSVDTRATFLRFESGHTSSQGLLAASAFTPAVGRWRGEIAGTAGASAYAHFARYRDALGGVRVHFLARGGGAWIGATLGRAAFGSTARPVRAATLALWSLRHTGTVTASVTTTRVGDTTYTDLSGLGEWTRGTVTIDGALGARVWSRGAGRGVYGEAIAVIALRPAFALVLAGGRYATDPTRGSIAGRYASVGVRIVGLRPARPERFDPAVLLASSLRSGAAAADPPAAPAALLEFTSAAGRCTFVVHAAAVSVEIVSDLSGWQPVALAPAGSDTWSVTLPAAPGLHRLNMRLDGGAWLVPNGLTPTADEFGGSVGLFVVR
jgi:hypothetical protein